MNGVEIPTQLDAMLEFGAALPSGVRKNCHFSGALLLWAEYVYCFVEEDCSKIGCE